MPTAKIEIPDYLVPVFKPARGELRYRGADGGRGAGAKSRTFATMAALFGYCEPLRIVCAREFQESIEESFFVELCVAIRSYPWLESAYEIGKNYIRGKNGTKFLFKGLRRHIQSIRSTSDIDITIVEEAEDVPDDSWKNLIPTVRRKPGSEIWVIWNSKLKGSATDIRFKQNKPSRSMIVSARPGKFDNPWFGDDLQEEMDDDRRILNPNEFAHLWEGAYLENSESQILAGRWEVDDFTPQENWNGPYHGLDFGFARDPTTANKCWEFDNVLYVEMEANKIGLELDDTAGFIKGKIPGIENYVIRADSARPESISYLRRHGLPKIHGVKKWPNSVEEGIRHLRSYKKIIIHPRCVNTIEEARLYSYKVDRLTGDVLTDIVDKYNHHIDDIRYALQPRIKRREYLAA